MCGRPPAFRQFDIEFRGYAQVLGRSPKFIEPIDGSAERFRTSGGIAESRWLNFLGKALLTWLLRLERG